MSGFMKVATIQEALAAMQASLPERSAGGEDLRNALGRRLSEPIWSPESIPAFPRSTVDGYAVRAQDTFGCSESLPSFLRFRGEVVIGMEPGFAIQPAECAWIPTGGMLPSGGDAAVMAEHTERLSDDTVLIYRPAGPGENIMQAGEDARLGMLLLDRGHRLRAQDIGLLASVGVTEVPVYRPYRVGILSTGNEIVPVKTQPKSGQVRDVNSLALAAAVQAAGGIPKNYAVVPDQAARLKEAVAAVLSENDWVILSGGSSVGVMDYTREALMSLPEARLLFYGLAVKPGKPTMAVRVGSKLIVGLPGHPVSALTMFQVLCQPFINMIPARQCQAIAGDNIASQAGRDDYVPVFLHNVDQEYRAQPVLGKSGLMTVLAGAVGYIHIAYEQQGILRGEPVTVTLYD